MRRTIHGCGSSTGSRVRSTRNGCSASNCRGAGVRAREHGEAIGRQPPPPLPQQRLDPADLGREVVRDEEVLHARWPARGRDRQAEPFAGPPGVLGEHRIVVPRGTRRERSPRPVVVAGRRVAEHDERVAAQPPWVSTGEVPAAVPIEQRAVVGGDICGTTPADSRQGRTILPSPVSGSIQPKSRSS